MGEGVGGGIIELISLKSIVNSGVLSARGVRGGKGGSIWICCKRFANENRIRCGDDGTVEIRCETASFEPLSIVPTPRIRKAMDSDSEAKFKRTLGPMRCVPLTVAAHRGHGYGDHPKHLLVNDTKRCYMSKWVDPNSDWIVFEVTEDTHFVIAQIRIRNNDDWSAGIKEIALSLGDRESVRNGQWTEWQRIADIHKNDDIQCFDVEPNLKQKAFEYVKLQIVQNHGSKDQNSFYHFSVFGFEFV